jgi:solute carrier family 8 (sodium/calcium exchanger)
MFWNPTVANLTLMALGSSAPEILLSCIETISGLNKCPGELGASTIVGSAAFNLLVISGVSIYAVSEENDTDVDRDNSVPHGVKKINDLGVFAITCSSSLFAYIWLFICVQDNAIEAWEAWFTFVMFFILIIMAFAADKYHNSKQSGVKEELIGDIKMVDFIGFTTAEIYRELI